MSADHVKAYPRKRFFVQMFTRDISAEDCVLDLLDNSIDALIKTEKIDLDKTLDRRGDSKRRRGTISLHVSSEEIRVEDDSGGIALHRAREEVFNFGHSVGGSDELTVRGIGAYGVGLKRAIFKLGRHFKVESVHGGIHFCVEQDLTQWVNKDERLEDWRFPLKSKNVSGLSTAHGGTRVTITRLEPEILELIDGNVFVDRLRSQIGKTYGPFLNSHVDVYVNKQKVEPEQVPLGNNEKFGLQKEEYVEDGVSVRIAAGLAAPGPRGTWDMERAGWYVLCNGRVVVFADRTTLTGWGAGVMPQFHSSKARGFVGVATFVSKDPLKLPWTTTKRGLNRESPVFLHAQSRMQQVGSIVYKALSSLYPSEEPVESLSDLRSSTQQAALKDVMGSGSEDLTFRIRRRKSEITEASVQYRVPVSQLEIVKHHIGNTNITNSQVGLYTFDYFVRQEGLE